MDDTLPDGRGLFFYNISAKTANKLQRAAVTELLSYMGPKFFVDTLFGLLILIL